MSLILKKEISLSTFVGVWQIAETEEFFFNFLHLLPEDESQIKTIKLQKIRLQKLACRAALAELLGNNAIGITYTETRQPQLKDHYISFSHTENTVAVAVAKIPVGIDIEELTPRILPLYSRFMSQQEIAACDTNNLKELYYFWCAKEAMYKWFAEKDLDFIEDLQVDRNENKGVVCKRYILQLTPIYIDNLLVVVCEGRKFSTLYK
ncbi:MAG: 4'-phosphopantetheinyl transferase superfamily protein [Lentimicrobiaceae bacterium]|nr:4'-phosphopantetheinyl transferase superfamily protein [Lentimicrobiaceae bacterium]